jgi:hypothetical protein
MDDGPRIEPAPPLVGTREVPTHLQDPRALQILTTEHWSLLTARSLVYNETFSRGAMFLTFLSASLVALGFIAGSGAIGSMLPLVAIPILALDLFVGLATLGRLFDATTEEFLALQGMARLRHAYLEIAPELEPYISTATTDDIMTVLGAYGPPTEQNMSNLRNIGHGLTTMPGMIMAIDAALAGALAAVVALVLGLAPVPALLVAILVGLLLIGVFALFAMRIFTSIDRRFEARFPAPLPAAAATDPAQDARRNT